MQSTQRKNGVQVDERKFNFNEQNSIIGFEIGQVKRMDFYLETGITVSSLSLPQFMLRNERVNGRINKSTNEWKNERHENFGAAVLFNQEIEKETSTQKVGRKDRVFETNFALFPIWITAVSVCLYSKCLLMGECKLKVIICMHLFDIPFFLYIILQSNSWMPSLCSNAGRTIPNIPNMK